MALSDLRGLVLTHGHHLVPGYPGTTYKYRGRARPDFVLISL